MKCSQRPRRAVRESAGGIGRNSQTTDHSIKKEGVLKKVDLTTIFIRLIGLYCLIQSISSLQGFTYIMGMSTTVDSPYTITTLLSSIVPGIILVIIGIIVLAQSQRLAHLITPPPIDEQISMPINFEYFQSILFSAVGVFVFLTTIPRIFVNVSSLITLDQSFYFNNAITPKFVRDAWFSLTGGLLQSIAGVFLFFQGKIVSGWWHRLRGSIPEL